MEPGLIVRPLRSHVHLVVPLRMITLERRSYGLNPAGFCYVSVGQKLRCGQEADTSPAHENRQILANGRRSPAGFLPSLLFEGLWLTSAVDWVPQ